VINYNIVNKYIGRPYLLHGRDMDVGVDCYGLVILVYKDILGVDLPDWQADSDSIKGMVTALERELRGQIDREYAIEKETPDDMDIITVSRHGRPHHMGVYVSGGVLHANQANEAVVFDPWDRFTKQYNEVRVWQWRV
jgi:cell wall-associated NlpC family hydrolase